MNAKASITKELNAKHRKILEELLKLPENRECADCKSKGARWASVNLGIFICMQCSGIHRSLGVHISKVRSATLDTWLPDQVAFIQSMGNEKSNSYWEAELPPKYDRVGIENFIRAKYVDKRWIPRDGKAKPLPSVREEKVPVYKREPGIGRSIVHTNNIEHFSEERKSPQLYKINGSISPSKGSNTVTPGVPEQVTPDPEQEEIHQKAEPAASKAELETKEANFTPVVSEHKVDYATDLFNLLSMDNSRDNGSERSASDGNTSAGLQSADAISTAEENVASKGFSSNNIQFNSGFEDLFKGLEWVSQPLAEKPPKVVKNDNLFEKSNMVSPVSIDQQQLSMQAQQQSLLMAATAKPFGGSQISSIIAHQNGSNSFHLPSQNRGSVDNQVTGSTMRFPQIGDGRHSHPIGSSGSYATSSMYGTRPVPPMSNFTTTGASRPPSTSTVAFSIPTQLGGDYDFSALTQGLFGKR